MPWPNLESKYDHHWLPDHCLEFYNCIFSRMHIFMWNVLNQVPKQSTEKHSIIIVIIMCQMYVISSHTLLQHMYKITWRYTVITWITCLLMLSTLPSSLMISGWQAVSKAVFQGILQRSSEAHSTSDLRLAMPLPIAEAYFCHAIYRNWGMCHHTL